MGDLEQKLEDSLHVFRGPFSTESERNSIHALLARLTRESRRYRKVEVERAPDAE